MNGPVERSEAIDDSICAHCDGIMNRHNPPGCDVCGTCEDCGCICDDEEHQEAY